MINLNSQFFATLTNVGAAKQANADALGLPWKITHMAIGDANGTDPVPSVTQTKLINEVRRAPLNTLKIDPANAAVIIAEQVIPADVGGFWIREIGLYDADGDFVAVANCAPSFKPLLVQGSGRTQIVRLNIIVTNAGNVELKIDPAVVLATRAYVDSSILEVLPKNKTAGQFTRLKVDARGIVQSGDNPETLEGSGIKDAYTKLEVEAMIAQASALPVGVLVGLPVNKTPPGFLELDGGIYSAASYPDLAAFLEGRFNLGNEGAGMFRLPETRAEFLRGWDHGRGLDVAREIGSNQLDALQNITGSWSPFQATSVGQAHTGAFLGSGSYTYPQPTGATNAGVSNISFDASRVARTSTETRPRNLAVMWCIKAWNAPINQGNIDIAALASQIQALSVNGPVVGTVRNARMVVTAASASASFTADELVVGDADGRKRVVRAFNQSINLAAAAKGAGAMDVGGAPVSGFVALYALFNADTNLSALMGVNASSAVAANRYSGAALPAGYTFSALIGVWPTNASGLFLSGMQLDRRFARGAAQQISTSVVGANTPITLADAPLNAKRVSGYFSGSASGSVSVMLLSDPANNFGGVQAQAAGYFTSPFAIDILTAKTIYYLVAISGGTLDFKLFLSGYEV